MPRYSSAVPVVVPRTAPSVVRTTRPRCGDRSAVAFLVMETLVVEFLVVEFLVVEFLVSAASAVTAVVVAISAQAAMTPVTSRVRVRKRGALLGIWVLLLLGLLRPFASAARTALAAVPGVAAGRFRWALRSRRARRHGPGPTGGSDGRLPDRHDQPAGCLAHRTSVK
jgi:hypothetical protein